MPVLMKHNGVRVLHRHIQQNETAVLAALEESGQLCWLAVPQRRKLPELFGVAKGHNL